MALVAIHQPNYFPWLGYFWKIAQSDIFVFLDDVQFSKNSFTNRTRVLCNNKARWLTVPVHVRLGDPISSVQPVDCGWRDSHLRALSSYYGDATEFRKSWPIIEEIVRGVPFGSVALINQHIVTNIARTLGLAAKFVVASALSKSDANPSERLVDIVKILSPNGTYISGQGGANYQDKRKFEASGIRLIYSDFRHPYYRQQSGSFVSGLSILDAIFNVGWHETAQFICRG